VQDQRRRRQRPLLARQRRAQLGLDLPVSPRGRCRCGWRRAGRGDRREAWHAEGVASTTFAVFRPTPGSAVSASMSAAPGRRAVRARPAPCPGAGLRRKNPVAMICGLARRW
jgi:hypothetical protein